MKLYNTMTRQNEVLQPLKDKQVKLYTCGLTVYSQPHIGNWLGYIYWDILVRILEHDHFNVERTQNITDVGHLVSDDDTGEDKLEKGARSEGLSAWEVAAKYSDIAEYEAYELLNLKRPTHLVRATDFIQQQIDFAQELEAKGFTYVIENEGLYFDTSKLNDYGKLAKLNIAGLEAGVRVAVGGKKHTTDFAIWKFSPTDGKRDMEWESPWGTGFPGWHLECSVIARETLGDSIDIHTGGIDHIPVHHTNEIAQTESVTGKQFAQIWLHNNHIKIDGKKISKSLGNIVTLSDIVNRGIDIDAFKLMTLAKHYRTEGNFSWDILEASRNRLANWRAVAALRHQTHDTVQSDNDKSTDGRTLYALAGVVAESLRDDLDTPGALAAIDQAFSMLENARLDSIHRTSLLQALDAIESLLGINLLDASPDIDEEDKQLIIERQRVREEKDWARSDAIRDRLLEKNVVVRDTPTGPIWSYNA